MGNDDRPADPIDQLRLTPAETILNRVQNRAMESSMRAGYGPREQYLFARYPELLGEDGGFRFRAGDDEYLTPLATEATDVDDVRFERRGERYDVDVAAVERMVDQQFVTSERVVPYRRYEDGIKPYVYNGEKSVVEEVDVRESDGERVAVLGSADSDYYSLLTARAPGNEVFRAATRDGLRLDEVTPTPVRDARGDSVADLRETDAAGVGVLVATVLNRAGGPHELLLARRSMDTTVERGRWSTRVSGGVEPTDDDPVRTTVVDEVTEELLGGDEEMASVVTDGENVDDRERVDAALDDGRADLRSLGVQLNTASGEWQLPVLLYAEDEELSEWLAERDEKGWEHEGVRRVELPLDGMPDELTPGIASYGAVGAVGLGLERLRDEFGVDVGDVEAGPVASREQAVAALAGRDDVDLTREDGEVRVAPPGRIETDDPVLLTYRTATTAVGRLRAPVADGLLSAPEVLRSGGRRLGLDAAAGELRRVGERIVDALTARAAGDSTEGENAEADTRPTDGADGTERRGSQ